jgi:dimethylargininase
MQSMAITRLPGENFRDGITSAGLGPPDYRLALRQHAAYRDALERCGLEVILLEPDPVYPDAPFVEDTAVITETTAIVTRPGDPRRRGEEVSIARALSGYREIQVIEPPGTVDGGDILRADNHFYIGLSGRTNVEGARQLASILSLDGHSSSTVHVRDSLHLKSGVNYMGDGLMIAQEKLRDLEFLGRFDIITVGEDESYAANCLPVNGTVIVPAGFPRTASNIVSAGHEIIELEMSEFMKMDGGLTCLSLRF